MPQVAPTMIQVDGGIDNTNQRHWLELVKRMLTLWDVCIYGDG